MTITITITITTDRLLRLITDRITGRLRRLITGRIIAVRITGLSTAGPITGRLTMNRAITDKSAFA